METYSEIERRRLIAILGENRELFALSCAKIFTAARDSGEWLDSDLEGFLCFVIDQNDKSKYFYLYDTSTYDKLFQIELYKDFFIYYTVVTNNFHCFEMNNGFIGFRFEKIQEAKKFGETVVRMSDDKKIIFTKKDKNKKTQDIMEIIKKNFLNKLGKPCATLNTEFLGDDGVEICQPKHFSLFNNITFDNLKQRFVIGDIPGDLKRLFKIIGIKKSDLKDTGYALNIFKILIQAFESIQNEKREKTIKLCKIKGKYLGEKENKIIDKSKNKSTKIIDNKPTVNNVLQNPATLKNPSITSVPSIPSVPKVPKIPNAPVVPVINIPQKATILNESTKKEIEIKPSDNPTMSSTSTMGSLQQQVGKVVLKPVDQRPIKINQNDQTFIKNINPLQLAIQQRREKLTKNDVNSDESENEWSDDD